MTIRIFLAALLAGILAGLAITPVQALRTTPLIIAAEAYEDGGAPSAHEHGALSLATPAHAHAPGAGADAGGASAARLGGTALANIVLGAGFALLLLSVSLVSGRAITARNGAVWGLLGFATLTLAPALGLPPELPAMPAADLGARQLWWLMAVLCTGLGIGVLTLARPAGLRAAGAALIVVPMMIAAPHPAELASPIPPTLAAEFAVASLTTSAIFWVLIGGLTGLALERFGTAGRLARA